MSTRRSAPISLKFSSAKLPDAEQKAFDSWVVRVGTRPAAGILKVSVAVIESLRNGGFGKPDTVARVRVALTAVLEKRSA